MEKLLTEQYKNLNLDASMCQNNRHVQWRCCSSLHVGQPRVFSFLGLRAGLTNMWWGWEKKSQFSGLYLLLSFFSIKVYDPHEASGTSRGHCSPLVNRGEMGTSKCGGDASFQGVPVPGLKLCSPTPCFRFEIVWIIWGFGGNDEPRMGVVEQNRVLGFHGAQSFQAATCGPFNLGHCPSQDKWHQQFVSCSLECPHVNSCWQQKDGWGIHFFKSGHTCSAVTLIWMCVWKPCSS